MVFKCFIVSFVKELMIIAAVKTLLIIVLAADFFLMLKINLMQNKPIYKIHGIKRRELKKELSLLKRFTKNYWSDYNLNNDMYRFYNCLNPNLPTKEQAQNHLDKVNLKIIQIENRLAVLYED